jgi:hypothetical protein
MLYQYPKPPGEKCGLAANLTDAAGCRLAHGLELARKETHQEPASARFS